MQYDTEHPIHMDVMLRDLIDLQGRRLSSVVGTEGGVTPLTKSIPQVVEEVRARFNVNPQVSMVLDYSILRPWLIEQLTPGSADGRQEVITTILRRYDMSSRYNRTDE